MNFIIPNTTKTQKETAKCALAWAKKLLNPAVGDRRPHTKHCFLKNNELYMTDGCAMVKFKLQFDAPGKGFYQLAMVGKELWLIDQGLDSEYPETDDFFVGTYELCMFERLDTRIIKFCKILHAMSTPNTIGCFDIEYFKLIPDDCRVFSTEVPYAKETARTPLVFRNETFEAVVMPINRD